MVKVWKILPPARLLWIALVAIALWGESYLGWFGIASLFLPLIAGLFDLGYQWLRFPSLRMPDGAIATGLFLALLFPPTAPLFLTATVTVVTISFKHALRWKGMPLFNPAALGVVLGGFFLGLSPSWWVGLGTAGQIMVPVLGAVLLLRDRSRWRVLVTFMVAYAGLASLYHVFFMQVTSPGVFALTILDPTVLFFALFMVVEPRTSPSDPAAQPMFGATVAIGTLVLSLIMPSLGILVALLAGNVLSAVVRPLPSKAPAARSASRKKPLPHLKIPEWTPARRGGIAFAVLILLAVVAAGSAPGTAPAPLIVSPGGTAPPPSGGSPGSLSHCQKDNPSIPAATLTQLHKMLGPSVILSYDSSTGTTVFYDPVNQVTVTETDLYEDYGYAEFNGDDYTVSGCSTS